MLTAETLYKEYRKRPVLNGVDLQAQGGEVIGIAGVNGSGKSTLLSVLTGNIKPDKGQVSLDNAPLHSVTLKKQMGYVPQENSLFENLSAWDNLKLWASAYKADWRNALEFLFPESDGEQKVFLKKKVSRLSGGMKKRLSVALSLMHEPAYLLMDEPTAGLDIGFRYNLSETIKRLRARGKCVIFTSHHTDELMLCDRVYVLREGIFIYEGKIQQDTDLYALTKKC